MVMLLRNDRYVSHCTKAVEQAHYALYAPQTPDSKPCANFVLFAFHLCTRIWLRTQDTMARSLYNLDLIQLTQIIPNFIQNGFLSQNSLPTTCIIHCLSLTQNNSISIGSSRIHPFCSDW
jgi:hypothetical protein